MADRADFAPELGALKSLRPFVFWAQTTLPTVFDDSLSYYEVLTKLCKMVNTLLENEDTNAENITALAEAYQELEDFTNNYFENLDVTQEINDKLDELVADGTIGGYVVERATTLFNDYLYGEDGESGKNKEINDMISEAQTDIEEALANFATRSNLAVTTFETNSAASIRTFEDRVDEELAGVSTIVEDWMDANFTNPSSVVIDDTLTTKDAAAEAYATGKLMDDATNMVLATSYWQDYVVNSVSGSFILADVSGGSNPAVGTGAPSKTLYIANVTPGETYIVSGVASSYSTTRYTPAYALGNLTYDASDNPYYEFYDVYPRGWDESQDPGTVYQYVRNQTVRIPTGTTPTVTHLFIVGDSRVPITVRCSRLNARTDTALTSETLPAQGKATGDALETKLPWPVSGGNKDLGTAGYGLVTNADGTTSWQEVGGDYDEEIENLQNDVVDLKSALCEGIAPYNPTNILPIDGTFTNETANGVTYTWANKTKCSVSGTSSGLAINTIYSSLTKLPANIKPGDVLKVTYETSTPTILEFVAYLNGSTSGGISAQFSQSNTYIVPDNCTGFVVRLRTPNGQTSSGEVYLSVVTIHKEDIDTFSEELKVVGINADNLYNTLVYWTNNTAVTNNLDGTYKIGTTDYGRSYFGGDVTLEPGKYLLYGCEKGYSYLSPDGNPSNAIITNMSTNSQIYTINETVTVKLCYRIASAPTAESIIKPFLYKITNSVKLDKYGGVYPLIGSPVVFPPSKPYSYTGSNITEQFLTGTGNLLTPLYSLYDELEQAFPHNMEKSVIGYDQSGTYEMRAYTISQDLTATLRPVILWISGVHASERYAHTSTFAFVKELLENHDNDDVLGFIWNNCTLKVVPIANPWGLANGASRYNSRGVNLNRNFPCDWVYSDEEYSNSGASPGSEAETQNIMNFIKANPNALFSVNRHDSGTLAEESGRMAYTVDAFKIDNNVIRPYFATMHTQCVSKYPWIVSGRPQSEYSLIFSTLSSDPTPGMMDKWFNMIGMHGCLLEISRPASTGYTADKQQDFLKINLELVVNMLASVLTQNQMIASVDDVWVKYPMPERT